MPQTHLGQPTPRGLQPLASLPPASSNAKQGSPWALAAGKMLELTLALSFQELPSPSGLLSAGFPMRQLQKPREPPH